MKIAINGFGRIGRVFCRIALDRDFNIVAVNDIHGVSDAAYLLKHDSVYGKYKKKVIARGDSLIVDGKKIKVLSEMEPSKLPWKKLGVDVVIESTGVFRDPTQVKAHIDAGAEYVLITAPCKGGSPDITVLPGVNEEKLKKEHKIISVASCTTNCLAPVVKVLNDKFGIKRAMMTTVHAYTNDQAIQDSYNSKTRRGRAAALNAIPTTTGASKSVVEVLPELLGKISGLAVRVPVAVGSLIDVVAELEKNFSVTQINGAFKRAADGPMKGVLSYSDEELVSSDIIGDSSSAVFDSLSTQKDGNLVKVLAWYDNEYGYSNRVADVVEMLEKFLRKK